MENQLFLALAYFVRKRLAKRFLLAFQIGKKMSNVQNTLIFLFSLFFFFFSLHFPFHFLSFSPSLSLSDRPSLLFPSSLLIRSAFLSFFLSWAASRPPPVPPPPCSPLAHQGSAPPPPPMLHPRRRAPPWIPPLLTQSNSAMAVASARHRDPTWLRPRHTAVLRFGC